MGGANIVEIFDPQREQFYQVADGAGGTRLFATATLLQDGDVLFTGGYSKSIATARQAWILNF